MDQSEHFDQATTARSMSVVLTGKTNAKADRKMSKGQNDMRELMVGEITFCESG